ncbi:5-oxoprolinase subunit PxpB [Fusibacter ferrireducens]|uniref:5-oxoprolinase subunit PxpB n=1 Tax=Fusibacter ferrireducens TaxID=2785058 RepID=A0ABR9ZXQ1_9FIRM|nr:5-oxoprolinase subunit PxpB [Fusibacter ferrireducens]MBF4695248.1 5-oxoprolinase subunit PxpB [Fusibacter ferrireducens]
MKPVYKIKPCGDCALSVIFENEISEEVNNHVASLKKSVESKKLKGFQSCIPTYCALLIRYSPLESTYGEWSRHIEHLLEERCEVSDDKAMVYVIPVYYGGEFGPDLDHVASQNQLEASKVIEIHTSNIYRIYMLGFTPGFPYLGGMDERIATPRLTQPRTKIEAGSVGIAGKQTGIYPIDSPGGWQIIGRTPVRLFDIESDPPMLLEAGNYIQFKEIDLKTFKSIEKLVSTHQFSCETYEISRGGVKNEFN